MRPDTLFVTCACLVVMGCGPLGCGGGALDSARAIWDDSRVQQAIKTAKASGGSCGLVQFEEDPPGVEGTWTTSPCKIFSTSTGGKNLDCSVKLVLLNQAGTVIDSANQGDLTYGTSSGFITGMKTGSKDGHAAPLATLWLKNKQHGPGGCVNRTVTILGMWGATQQQDKWSACGWTITLDKECEAPDWFNWAGDLHRQ